MRENTGPNQSRHFGHAWFFDRLAVCACGIWALALAGCDQPASGVTYAGGDGSTMEKAVIVQATNDQQGSTAEYVWLQDHFPGFHNQNQSVTGSGSHSYDQFDIVTADGQKRSVYFDSTSFVGK